MPSKHAMPLTAKKVPDKDPKAKSTPSIQRTPFCPGGSVTGTCAPGWEAVKEAFTKNFENGMEQGAQLCILQGEEVVLDICGVAEGTETFPNETYCADTIQCVYSSGKNIEVAVIAFLVDRKLVSYSDPISVHWPAFGQKGKEKVTIADLMRHSSGVPFFMDPNDEDKYNVLSLKHIQQRSPMHHMIEISPLVRTGRTEMTYHGITRGMIVDGILKHVDPAGRTIGQFVKEEFLTPLAIDDSYFVSLQPEESKKKSVALMTSYSEESLMSLGGSKLDPASAANLKLRDPSNKMNRSKLGADLNPLTANEAIGRQVELSSGFNFASARSLSRFLSIFANGGEAGGVRLLSQDTVSSVIDEAKLLEDTEVFRLKAAFTKGGFGKMDTIHLLDCPSNVFGNTFDGFYGWCGLGGSVNVVNPEKKLTVSYAMNAMCHHFIGGPRIDSIFAAIVETLESKDKQARNL